MTLSALGIFSAAGAGGAAPFSSDYELITTQILGSSAASVTFSSLGTYSSTYKHLQIRASGRADDANFVYQTSMRLNGDTGSNYSSHNLSTEGGASVSSTNRTNQTWMRLLAMAGGGASSSAFSGIVTDILDAYSTSKNKTIRTLAGHHSASTSNLNLSSGAWRNTASITSISFHVENGQNFVAGSRFSLYGIKG